MTEDEAFVRAVVDSPGDDTPRLAYADWLSDRGDPRADYLRAEFEWAKPWRAGTPPADDPRLWEMAARLDPVWVARVSRPPAGVCCEHVRLSDGGPTVTSEDVYGVERELAGRFSAACRAFFLNYNGGTPKPPCIPDPNRGEYGPLCLEIGTFFAAGVTGEVPPPDAGFPWGNRIAAQREFLEYLFDAGGNAGPNPLIAGMAPIAHTLHDLGYLLVGIVDTNRGRVFHFTDYCHNSDDPGHLTELSSGVADLLARLGPDLED